MNQKSMELSDSVKTTDTIVRTRLELVRLYWRQFHNGSKIWDGQKKGTLHLPLPIRDHQQLQHVVYSNKIDVLENYTENTGDACRNELNPLKTHTVIDQRSNTEQDESMLAEIHKYSKMNVDIITSFSDLLTQQSQPITKVSSEIVQLRRHLARAESEVSPAKASNHQMQRSQSIWS